MTVDGEWMYKYSFSDSRRVKRYFRLEPENGELVWGSSPDDHKYLRVELYEAVGIIYGPLTTTFSRLEGSADAPASYQCFSILFVGRTLDLCTLEDTADVWFQAIHSIIREHSDTLAPPMSRRDILFRKVWLKLCDTARRSKQSVVNLFRTRIAQVLQTKNSPRTFSTQISGLRDSIKGLRTAVTTAHTDLFRTLSLQIENLLKQLSDSKPIDDSKDQVIQRLTEELKASQAERIRLHNELVDLRGNIRVFARVRPLLPGEFDDLSFTDGSPTFLFPDSSDNSVSVYIPRDVRRRMYDFDRVFQPSLDQAELFEALEPFVQSAIDGFNVCVFSYGVTNSGKTYSMQGTREYPGINQLAIGKIFNSPGSTASVSVVQIYNETISDLLNEGKELDIRTSAGSEYSLEGVVEHKVLTAQEALETIRKASGLRAINSTKINQVSSRSHLVVTISMSSGGRLHLIDLAGSENVNKSGATGGSLREAQNINKSLSALGDVVHALLEKKNNPTVHVPYRNSKLTMLLRDSLGGNSKTVMILQVSPAQSDLSESLNSLSFGKRIRTVEVGKPTKFKHVSPRE